MNKQCVMCPKHFDTNYHNKITCSHDCKIARKIKIQREKYPARYAASKVGTANNNFLRGRV